MPGLALLAGALLLARRFIGLPAWAVWGLFAAWVLKDLVLFPFVWRAYQPPEGRNPMLGARGVASGTLAPSGYVRIGGELWKATTEPGSAPIDRGEPVRVTDVRGLTVIVAPDEEPADSGPAG